VGAQAVRSASMVTRATAVPSSRANTPCAAHSATKSDAIAADRCSQCAREKARRPMRVTWPPLSPLEKVRWYSLQIASNGSRSRISARAGRHRAHFLRK
jgi:hypothetical protein